MKKILLFFTAMCIGTFFSLDSYACRNSNCKPCPDGFSYTEKCCRNETDCVIRDKYDVFCDKAGVKGYTQIVKDCCNSDFTECTGSVRMCPRCR